MTKVRLITALSLATMLFASCEKQVEESPAPRSVTKSAATASLLPGDWQLTSLRDVAPVANTTKTTTTDIYPMLNECKKDDQLRFGPGGDLAELTGTVKCSTETGTPATPGSWVLSPDYKTLTLTQGKAQQYTVTTLTASTLKLRTVAAPNESYTELVYSR